MDAFSDYVQDASHVTEYSFTNRAIKNGVDLDISVGAFSDGKLIGFTLVGIDHFDGRLSAFDAGTGIIKPHRGKGIAKEMFDFLTPKLKRMRVERFILEVLTENTPAIRAYQKANFKITRELDSFELVFENLRLDDAPNDTIEIQTITKDQLLSFQGYLDWQPSWENSLSSIGRISNKVMLIGARYKGMKAGILVYYPMLNWILCLAVNKEYRRRRIASHLLGYLKNSIGEQVQKVRLINVQHTDKGMIQFLNRVGFKYTFDQYEMEKELN
jgi:ribosomal protein S18 acetylase RimI-like enzyme